MFEQKPLNKESTSRTIMDYLLFFFSAAIISGVIIGFFYTKQFTWMMVGGYFLALFWMLITWGYRAYIKLQIQYIKQLESAIIELVNKQKENK